MGMSGRRMYYTVVQPAPAQSQLVRGRKTKVYHLAYTNSSVLFVTEEFVVAQIQLDQK